MTTDIAALGIRIDTSGVKAATTSLDDLARAGGKAEASTTALSKATDILANAAKAAAAAFGAYKLLAYAQEATLLAARFETMGVVMRIAGNNAGYTMAQMEAFSKSLQTSGISMLQSRNSLTQLATANIDLANATKLGRAAQDLAVVSQTNSSDALGRMIIGIKSGQTEILRTMGLNVSFETGYKTLAASMGKTTSQLTEHDKTLARTTETLKEASRYNGIYEESMTTAGKAMYSLDRYFENVKILLGNALLPALANAVFKVTDEIKGLNKELENTKVIGDIGVKLAASFDLLLGAIVPVAKVTAAYFALFVAGPAIIAAVGTAMTTAAGALALWGYNALFTTTGTIGLNTALFGTSVNAALAAGSLTMLSIATKGLFAAFIGWEIGTYLRDQFVEVRVAGLAFIGALLTGFENLKYGALLAGAAIASLIPGTDSYAVASAKLESAHKKELAAIDANIVGLVQYELAEKNAAKASGMTEAQRIAAGAASKAAAEAEEKAAEAAKKHAAEALKAAQAYKAVQDSADQYIVSLLKESDQLGMTDKQKAIYNMTSVATTLNAGKERDSFVAVTTALIDKVDAFKEAEKATKALDQATKDVEASYAQHIASMNSSLEALQKETAAEQEKYDRLGLTKEAIGALDAAKLESLAVSKDQAAQDALNYDQDYATYELYKKQSAAMRERAGLAAKIGVKEGELETVKKVNEEWKKGWEETDRIGRETFIGLTLEGKTFADSVGKSLKTALAGAVYDLFMRPILLQVYTSMVGSAVSSATGSAGGSALTGGLGSMGGNYVGGITGASAFSTGFASMAGEASLGASFVGPSVAAAGGATGAGAGAYAALSAIPVAGWIALAVVAAYEIWGQKSGGPKTESGYGTGLDARQATLGGPIADYVKGLETGYANAARQLGITGSTMTAGAFSATDPAGTAKTQLQVAASINGRSVYDRGALMGGIENVGRTPEELAAAMSLEASRAVFAALQASTLPEYLAGVFDGLSAGAVTQQQVTDVLTLAQSFADLHTQLQALPFAALKDMSYATAAGLVAATGGMQQLGTNLGVYYDKFYKEEEKRAQSITNINRTLTEAGVLGFDAATATRDAYRQLVDSQEVMTPAGQRAYTALISVAGAFDLVTPAAAAAVAAIALTQDQLTANVISAQTALTTAEGNVRDTLRSIGDIVQEFADAAKQSAQGVVDARDAISQGYFAAQDAMVSAQTKVNDLLIAAAQKMQAFGQTIDDFLTTINPATSAGASLQSLKAQLSSTAVLAASDPGAQSKLIAQAQAVLNSGMANSTSALDYARTEAFVRTTLEGVKAAVVAPKITSEDFRAMVYAGGATDAEANARGLEYARLNALSGQQAVDLWNKAFGSSFTLVDYNKLAEANSPLALAQADLLKAQNTVSAYTLAIAASSASTDRATSSTAVTAWSLLNAFNAAKAADDAAKTAYATALTLTGNLALTQTGTLNGLMAELAGLGAANHDAYIAQVALTAAQTAAGVTTGDLTGAFKLTDAGAALLTAALGLTGAEADAMRLALEDPATAATTLATVLGGLSDVQLTAFGAALGTSAITTFTGALTTTQIDLFKDALTTSELTTFLGSFTLAGGTVKTNAADVFLGVNGVLTTGATGAFSGVSTAIHNAIAAQVAGITINVPAAPVTAAEAVYHGIGSHTGTSWTKASIIADTASAFAAGMSPADIAKQLATNGGGAADILDAMHRAHIPGYAVGTNSVPFDMLANVHAGETITPRPFVDIERAARAETNALIACLLASNERLEKKVEALQKPADATAAAADRTKDLTEQVVVGGLSVQTRAAETPA